VIREEQRDGSLGGSRDSFRSGWAIMRDLSRPARSSAVIRSETSSSRGQSHCTCNPLCPRNPCNRSPTGWTTITRISRNHDPFPGERYPSRSARPVVVFRGGSSPGAAVVDYTHNSARLRECASARKEYAPAGPETGERHGLASARSGRPRPRSSAHGVCDWCRHSLDSGSGTKAPGPPAGRSTFLCRPGSGRHGARRCAGHLRVRHTRAARRRQR
jgi:hypothetical protein